MSGKETQARLFQKVHSCCESEANYQKHSAYLIEKAQGGDQLFVTSIIDNVKKLIKDKKEPASNKFYALLLLKECMDKKSKPLQAYVAKKILKRFKALGKEAGKSNGESVFGKTADPASCQKFSQLLLECISEWAVSYAMGDNPMEVTKYKQIYTDLIKSKVKFPQKNVYFQKKPPNPPPKEEKSSGLRNSVNNPISSKNEEKKESKSNVSKSNNAMFNDPTLNKPPALIKPVEKASSLPPAQIKKPEQKPVNNNRVVKDARESLATIKESINFLLDVEEILVDDVMGEFKSRMKYLAPEKITEIMQIEEMANDENFIEELFLYSTPGLQIVEGYEKFKKNQISFDNFKKVVINQIRDIEENRPPTSQPKPKNEPKTIKNEQKTNKFDKPQMETKPVSTQKFEENSAKLSKKPSFTENNNNFGFDKPSAGVPTKKQGSQQSNDFSNPFGGNNNQMGGNNNNNQFENNNSINQFEQYNGMQNSQFNNNNNMNQFGNNQFGGDFNNDPNQFKSNNSNQFGTFPEPPKVEAKPALKKKESNTEFKSSHPSQRDLPQKIPSKNEIFGESKQQSQNEFGGNFGFNQAQIGGFTGFNDFFSNSGGGGAGGDFQYMTNFDQNANANNAGFDMGSSQKNPFQPNFDQHSAGFEMKASKNNPLQPELKKKESQDGFGIGVGFPGFEAPQFQFEIGGDNDFSKANHSFKEDDAFKPSKELENSGGAAFNFNFDPSDGWNNFTGPIEEHQVKPQPLDGFQVSPQDAFQVKPQDGFQMKPQEGLQEKPREGFPMNQWDNWNEEGKEEVKENYGMEGGQGEWGEKKDWNFDSGKDKNIGNAFEMQMGGHNVSPQFHNEAKKNVVPPENDNDQWGPTHDNGMGWGNEQNATKMNTINNNMQNWGNEHQEQNNNNTSISQNWGHDQNNMMQNWGNDQQNNMNASNSHEMQGWGNNVPETNNTQNKMTNQLNIPQSKNNETNSFQQKSSNQLNTSQNKINEINSAQLKMKSQRSLSQNENEFGNNLNQSKNMQNWDFANPNLGNEQNAQFFQNNQAKLGDFGFNVENDQDMMNFQNPPKNVEVWGNQQNGAQNLMDFSRDKSQNNLPSQQNLNVSQNNNLNMSHNILNASQNMMKNMPNNQLVTDQNLFHPAAEEKLKYPSLPNSDAYNFQAYQNNIPKDNNYNFMDVNNANQNLQNPEFNNNNFNNMNDFATNMNPFQNPNMNKPKINQPQNNLLDDAWSKDGQPKNEWVDFNENNTNEAATISDNLSGLVTLNKNVVGNQNQLNSIFNTNIQNPLVKPVDNQNNLLDFDMIPTKDQNPIMNPQFDMFPSKDQNPIMMNNQFDQGFNNMGNITNIGNVNNFTGAQVQASNTNLMDDFFDINPQPPNPGFTIPNNSKPQQSNLGYQYPTVNPNDLMNFGSQNQGNTTRQEKISNIASSAHNMTGDYGGPSDFQSNKHANLYNFLDNMTTEPQNQTNNKFVNESKVTNNLLNNFEQTGINNLNVKTENTQLINEFKKEKEELLQEMKKLRQSYEELKENLQKPIKKDVPIIQTDFQALNKDSVFSPFFPQNQEEKSKNEETKVLKERIDTLTEEIKKINMSVNNSPNKAENPIISISPVKNANQSVNESFLNSFEPETHPNTYSYTTIFRRKQPMSQNNSRANCSIIGNFNFYTVAIGRKQRPYTNSFLLEKPRSLNTSSVFNTSNRKGNNLYKENLNEDYVDENSYHKSFETPRSQKMQRVEHKNLEWREFIKRTNNSEILLNIDNFKYSCLNKKGVLFENEIYQVGVVFENDLNGNSIFSIYFGNKTKEEMSECNLTLTQMNGRKSNERLTGIRDVINGNSQMVVEINFDTKISWEKTIMEFKYKFQDEILINRIPLPNTLNKFASFGFISENNFKDRFREIESRNVLTNDEIDCNPRFIEVLEDFQRFLPEMVFLPSKKLKGSFMKNKKLGGVLNLEGSECLLRIVMNYERKVMFQIGLEKGNIGVRKIAENLIDVFCFLFGNI